MTRLKALVAALALAVTFAVVPAQPAEAAFACASGTTLAIDTTGPYYVFTVNTPASYAQVWLGDNPWKPYTWIASHSTYGSSGQRVRVCYTPNVYTYGATHAPNGWQTISTSPLRILPRPHGCYPPFC